MDAMFEMEAWAKQITQRWNERFDALDEVLQAEKKKTLKMKEKGREDK